MNANAKGNLKRKRFASLKENRADRWSNNYMKCARCGGAMVFERHQATVEIFFAWRCVNCGDIMDPVVQRNRELIMAHKGQAVGE